MSADPSRVAFTIGYEGRTPDDLLSILKDAGVTVLVDVRRHAASRKPGFAKSALGVSAEIQGMGYQHLPELGPPLPALREYRASGDWDRLTAAYETHLAEVEGDLERIEQLAATQRICFLCYEADAERCHRSLLARHLVRRPGGLREIRNL